MEVDTGTFEAIREEVAALAEQVRILREQAFVFRLIHEDVAIPPMPPCRRRERPGYLRPVDGDQR